MNKSNTCMYLLELKKLHTIFLIAYNDIINELYRYSDFVLNVKYILIVLTLPIYYKRVNNYKYLLFVSKFLYDLNVARCFHCLGSYISKKLMTYKHFYSNVSCIFIKLKVQLIQKKKN